MSAAASAALTDAQREAATGNVARFENERRRQLEASKEVLE